MNFDQYKCLPPAFQQSQPSIKRVDLDRLGDPSFKTFKNYVCVTINLDSAKVRMSGYWKFNSSLFLEIILKWELTGAIIGNSRLAKLTSKIRSFAVD